MIRAPFRSYILEGALFRVCCEPLTCTYRAVSITLIYSPERRPEIREGARKLRRQYLRHYQQQGDPRRETDHLRI